MKKLFYKIYYFRSLAFITTYLDSFMLRSSRKEPKKTAGVNISSAVRLAASERFIKMVYPERIRISGLKIRLRYRLNQRAGNRSRFSEYFLMAASRNLIKSDPWEYSVHSSTFTVTTGRKSLKVSLQKR